MLVFRVTECVTDVCYSSCLFSSTVFVLALKSMSISELNICERNLSLRVVTKGGILMKSFESVSCEITYVTTDDVA